MPTYLRWSAFQVVIVVHHDVWTRERRVILAKSKGEQGAVGEVGRLPVSSLVRDDPISTSVCCFMNATKVMAIKSTKFVPVGSISR